MSQPVSGAPIKLGEYLNRMNVFGVVSDGETPGVATATFDLIDDDSVLVVPVLKGDKGEPGMPSPIIDVQYDPDVTEPSDLPTNLTIADKDKGWQIGGVIYVWTGTGYVQRAVGPTGRPGPVPQLSITIERVAPGTGTTIEQSGTAAQPHLHIKVDPPAGPMGPASSIVLAADYDNTLPPENGNVVTWNETKGKWEASDFAAKHPALFSVPESAFQDMAGIVNGRQTILSWDVPPLDYAWVPYITGHFKSFGVDLNIFDPFTIGAEVRLGDPLNGELIARGVGNISTWTTVIPHFSSPGDPTAAVSPDNEVAQVAAGVSAKINVNLINDGILGMYAFNKKHAQLAVLAIPQGD